MKKCRLEDMKAGWFIGDFEPSLLRTKDFEVAVKMHPKGEIWDIHYHKVSREYNCLVKGSMTICGENLHEGNIFVIEPNEIANPVFHEDCTIVTVKTPSQIGDKYVIKREEYPDLIKIAHRGNFSGKNSSLENTKNYIDNAIENGYYCEVDVWYEDGKLYLGHDEPSEITDLDFLSNRKIICHAKSRKTAIYLSKYQDVHYFCHDEDFCAVTSNGWIWQYPEVYFGGKLIGFCCDNLL